MFSFWGFWNFCFQFVSFGCFCFWGVLIFSTLQLESRFSRRRSWRTLAKYFDMMAFQIMKGWKVCTCQLEPRIAFNFDVSIMVRRYLARSLVVRSIPRLRNERKSVEPAFFLNHSNSRGLNLGFYKRYQCSKQFYRVYIEGQRDRFPWPTTNELLFASSSS